MRIQVSIISFFAFVGACLVIWGIINWTNGYNLFNENELNVAKGIVGLTAGFFMILVKPYIPSSMVKY